MKKKFVSIAFTLFAIAGFAQKDVTVIEPGAALPAADVKMENVVSGDINLNDALGKNGLLVMFSCNTCPYVIKNQQRTKAISDYAAKNNFGVVIINSNQAQFNAQDSKEAMKAYAKKQKYTVPYVIDANSEVANAFGATKTPEVFLFNKDKVLVYRGAIDDNSGGEAVNEREHLKEAINEMVAGKEVSVKTSKSFGCSIKRS